MHVMIYSLHYSSVHTHTHHQVMRIKFEHSVVYIAERPYYRHLISYRCSLWRRLCSVCTSHTHTEQPPQRVREDAWWCVWCTAHHHTADLRHHRRRTCSPSLAIVGCTYFASHNLMCLVHTRDTKHSIEQLCSEFGNRAPFERWWYSYLFAKCMVLWNTHDYIQSV